ncbi:MAG: hypothetical protein GY895_15820 [Phycisphaera sp.]|nr:hypothetical protein [Phycisphaera sp.]
MPVRLQITAIATMTAALLAATPLIASDPTSNQETPSGNGAQEDGRPSRGNGQNPNGRQADPGRIVARLMQTDTDGDGRLSREEIEKTRFAAAFDQADADGDGYVTEKEITVFMTNRRSGGGAGQARPRGERPAAGRDASKTDDVDPVKAFEAGMEACGRSLRGLRRTKFDDATFDKDLAAAMGVQAGLLEARRHVQAIPMSQAAVAKFGQDRKAYTRSFQTHMAKSLVIAFQLEIAILEGDSASAGALTKQLVAGRNDSHDIFED